MAMGLGTCEDHDCVVVYSGRKCPMCELVSENEGYEKIVEELRDKYEDACAYASELADELAEYNRPIPEKHEGRKFRV